MTVSIILIHSASKPPRVPRDEPSAFRTIAWARGRLAEGPTRRTHKDRLRESHLLCRTFREDGQVKNETFASLSHLLAEALEAFRLRGVSLVVGSDAFSDTGRGTTGPPRVHDPDPGPWRQTLAVRCKPRRMHGLLPSRTYRGLQAQQGWRIPARLRLFASPRQER